MQNRPIYLDYQASTPMDPRVLDAMLPYFIEHHGNPHAEENLHGRAAAQSVALARGQIADLIGAHPREIVFTSGATESNNLLIRGAAQRLLATGKTHIVTCAAEHKSVLEVCKGLSNDGFSLTILPVQEDGRLDVGLLSEALGPQTGLVSVMAANNEIGVLQPLEAIGELCRSRGVLLHTDAAQAVGKIEIDVSRQPIDLLSLSGHKIYGPMGIGAAFIRRQHRQQLEPLMWGGGQEGGLRSGTLPTPLCVGLGVACSIAGEERSKEAHRLLVLRTRLLAALQASAAPLVVNGSLTHRLSGNLNVSFEGVDSEALLMTIRQDIAVSSGSACTAATIEPSHVILALGSGLERAESAIRIGLGRTTTEEEIDRAAVCLANAVQFLRGVRYRPQHIASGMV